ncbi:MAG: NifB/NifX family molybdenum-iron cluster-binding protein [Bacteroidales bacterium]|nr:NifB/NifX family molybdenum-iron cluster-binding protein [Bacteroidales bacterium]
MIKIAVPTKGNMVESHFGHCETYTIFTTDKDCKIAETELLSVTGGGGCKSDIAPVLKSKGVSVMLAGGMGEGAISVFENENIEVVRGCSGNITDVVLSYLKGEITDSGVICTEQGSQHGKGKGHSEGEHSCKH